MFTVVVICVVLATTTADQLDADALQGFQAAFYGTIMKHLDAEYKLLQPAIAQQSQSMANCRSMIVAACQMCESCSRENVKEECPQDTYGIHLRASDIGDWIVQHFGGVSNWFAGAGRSFDDRKAWLGIGGFFGDVGNSFINWSGWGDMGNFFSGVGSNLGTIFGKFGSTLGNSVNSFGNFMGNTFNKISKGLGSLFGHRRRDVSGLGMTARRFKMIRNRYIAKRMEEARECMRECTECTPFIGDQTAMIGGVCGDQILLDQAAMADVMSKMKALFDANGHPEDGTPIHSMVEYDKSTIGSLTFTCGGVYVTAVTPGGVIRYPSAYRYNLQFPQTTANELAIELVDKWEV